MSSLESDGPHKIRCRVQVVQEIFQAAFPKLQPPGWLAVGGHPSTTGRELSKLAGGVAAVR